MCLISVCHWDLYCSVQHRQLCGCLLSCQGQLSGINGTQLPDRIDTTTWRGYRAGTQQLWLSWSAWICVSGLHDLRSIRLAPNRPCMTLVDIHDDIKKPAMYIVHVHQEYIIILEYMYAQSIPYSWKSWRFGGLYYNRQIRICQNFLYIHVGWSRTEPPN